MDGTHGATNPGNTNLVEFGIQNEKSHLRAHVCPVVQRVYVYPTAYGIDAMEGHRCVYGYQDGVSTPTARGYLVPPFDIQNCVSLAFNPRAWSAVDFTDKDSLTEKGRKATRLILAMIERGLFPLPALAEEVTDYELQVEGQDIYISSTAIECDDVVIQVKCDYEGGEKSLGGTGNLFLQIAECNPFGYN